MNLFGIKIKMYFNFRIAIVCASLLYGSIIKLFSQVQELQPVFSGASRAKQIYITWGYNRSYYNTSDIHFQGEGYDFTLIDARAEDVPEKFDPSVYFNPTQFTVPQFNFRAGYYIGKNTAISAGWDHMKYHLIPTQLVEISGNINKELSPLTQYTGHFDHDYMLYNSSFMDYHHSDGFNFLRLSIEQRMPFWQSPRANHIFALHGAFSLGATMPWTDFTFFGEHHRNKPHFAGYGVSVHAGMRYEFLKYFFLQFTAQFGWTNLVDIMLEDDLPSRAEQKIVFLERAWALGGYIPVFSNSGNQGKKKPSKRGL